MHYYNHHRLHSAIGNKPPLSRSTNHPGHYSVGELGRIIGQGEPPPFGRYLYESLDPISHPERDRRECPIRFDVGASDTHVPAEAAERFRVAAGADAVEVQRHDGDHLDVMQDDRILKGAVAWLAARCSLLATRG